MSDSRTRCNLVVMAKAPQPGKVKTRLATSLGEQKACEVYRQLLVNTLQILSSVDMSRILSCSPDIRHPVFRELATKYSWRRQKQPTGDLGQRMAGIVSSGSRDANYTIIVGSDLANITPQIVEQSLARLIDGHELVIGSTDDGGYGLIAMSRLYVDIFRDIPWSTGQVLTVTLDRARELKLEAAVIQGLWDVDDVEDYRRWLSQGNACVV